MQQTLLFTALFSIFGIQCHHQSAEKPSADPEKMARIQADMSIAEAATVGLGGTPKDSLLQHYFKQVLALHGTTAEQYEKDLQYYSLDLEQLKQISKRAEEMLSKEEKKTAPPSDAQPK